MPPLVQLQRWLLLCWVSWLLRVTSCAEAHPCGSEVLMNTDIGTKGSEFMVFEVENWLQCCQLCSIADGSRGPQCTHWVFDSATSHYCYLKANGRSSASVRTPLEGFISGVVPRRSNSQELIDTPAYLSSCVGQCGLQALSSDECRCDALCEKFDDCCADFTSVCDEFRHGIMNTSEERRAFIRQCLRGNGSNANAQSFPAYCEYLAQVRFDDSNRTIALIQNSGVTSFPVELYGGIERVVETQAMELHRLGIPFFVVIPGRRDDARRGTYPFQVYELHDAPGLDALPADGNTENNLLHVYLGLLSFAEAVIRFLAQHPLRDSLYIWSQEAWSAELSFLGRPHVVTAHSSLGAQSWLAPEVYREFNGSSICSSLVRNLLTFVGI